LQERRRYEKERNRIWFEHQKLLADTAEKMEQQRLEYEKEKLRAAAHINQWKAKDDKAREYFLNRVLYTNPPTDAYFSQFNTTSR
jgi:hypothetical protein